VKKKLLLVGVGIVLFIFVGLMIFKASSMFINANAAQVSEPDIDNGAMLFEKAEKLISEGELLKARNACLKIMEKFPNSANIQKVQETLDDINIKILFSSIVTKDSFVYEVQKGDSLAKISKNFNTTGELIMRSNGLKDNSLRIGKKLKICKTRFSIVVDKSQNILTLKGDKDIVKTYRVATGKNNCTPVGNFTIINKIVSPPWYPPTGGVVTSGDPKNVLGTRWMGISKPSYGIHGTIQPDSIGKSVTEGCVRLKNSEVEELYAIVPVGTEVVIVD